MRVADYIAKRLAEWGTRHIFLVTGGGAMHLNDAFGAERSITCVCHHHEQAAAMAAEAYARITNRPSVINVTTGPGGINALNGVFGAWTDSVPMLVISGQVKRETCMAYLGISGLRQLGDQEVDIVRMAKAITKFAVLVTEPSSIRYNLERAYHLAQTGRPGPCWLDIPVDVQGAQVDEASMRPYDPGDDASECDDSNLEQYCREVADRICDASRPVVMAGTGIRVAGVLDEFEELIRLLRIPVTTAWTHDVIETDDDLFCGRPGTIGERAGNFTVQNSDLILVLGSRLNIRQVSYNWSSFAPRAFKIQVDVDRNELEKPLVQPDLPIHADLKTFLPMLVRELKWRRYVAGRHESWRKWCRERVRRFPVVSEAQRTPGPPLNPYYFIEQLSGMLELDDVVVCGDATACIVTFQVMNVRRGQRLISNSGSASMGYDLPASIGAAFASGGRVLCLAGDGSLQLNIQELQTIFHHKLPVKIFVLNNGGYLSIRTTQKNFFGRCVGESAATGVSFPDFVKVACAYGIPSIRIERAGQFEEIRKALSAPGPTVCEVMLDCAQEFQPRLKSKQLADGRIVTPPLEDMYPFLEPEELAANMIPDEG